LRFLQGEIAEKNGVDESTINNWERQRNQLEIRFIARIIEFLGYAPYYPGAPLGRRLRFVRQSLGITQRNLANLLGVGWSSVRNWDLGRRLPIPNYREKILVFFRNRQQALPEPSAPENPTTPIILKRSAP